MITTFIAVTVRDRVATLTLSNPPLNAVTLRMTGELSAKLACLADDPGIGSIVLAGGGGTFCCGSDIKEFPGLVAEDAIVSRKLATENAVYSQLAHFPKPTVAAIDGFALGGGLELASACDLIVASADAKLGLPEVKVGAFPGSGGAVRVTRRIGVGRANELVLLGDPISAEQALLWGLVNRIATPGETLGEAQVLARRMAHGPSQALFACKRALRDATDLPEGEAIDRSLLLSQALSRTSDFREGVAAFIAKRQPTFGDRLDTAAFGAV